MIPAMNAASGCVHKAHRFWPAPKLQNRIIVKVPPGHGDVPSSGNVKHDNQPYTEHFDNRVLFMFRLSNLVVPYICFLPASPSGDS